MRGRACGNELRLLRPNQAMGNRRETDATTKSPRILLRQHLTRSNLHCIHRKGEKIPATSRHAPYWTKSRKVPRDILGIRKSQNWHRPLQRIQHINNDHIPRTPDPCINPTTTRNSLTLYILRLAPPRIDGTSMSRWSWALRLPQIRSWRILREAEWLSCLPSIGRE